MDLTKIAENTEMTYLEKVATIVDEFATGNITGENADAIASEAGISPEDLLSVYNASYGEADMEKTASEDEGMTYLEKVATVVDGYAEGEFSEEDVNELAAEHGLDVDDIEAVLAAAYGDEEFEDEADIEKVAADEAFAELEKVAGDESSTYLEKCASIADVFASGAITGEEGDEIAVELGLEPEDVATIYQAAYADELEKEAGVKDKAVELGRKVKKAAKKYTGYDDLAAGKKNADRAKYLKGSVIDRVTGGHGAKYFKGKAKTQAAKGAAKMLGTGAAATAVGAGTVAATRD